MVSRLLFGDLLKCQVATKVQSDANITSVCDHRKRQVDGWSFLAFAPTLSIYQSRKLSVIDFHLLYSFLSAPYHWALKKTIKDYPFVYSFNKYLGGPPSPMMGFTCLLWPGRAGKIFLQLGVMVYDLKDGWYAGKNWREEFSGHK